MATGATRAVKGLVDTGDVHENFWKVINFSQGCARACALPVTSTGWCPGTKLSRPSC
ncbi:hypothetical protein ACFZCK_23475 [Kitasatospora purpeofusca]|uniref:hypothetical protein n=1 Tax=Kitasatospora purpeofusca TaxID=67352 RepID=UPI0036E163E5